MASIKLLNSKIFKKIKENTFNIDVQEESQKEISMNKILENYEENKNCVY